MPPSAVKTVGDLIHWQYSKIISSSAGVGKRNYRFVMERFKKLQQEEIFWNEIREYVKEREKSGECIFCGEEGKLTKDHLFPTSLNGPNTERNIVWVCSKCNSWKSKRRLYEVWTIEHGLKAAKYDVPRIAEGKYLKLLYEIFKKNGMLGFGVEEIKKSVCPKCDMKKLCAKEKSVGKFSPLCLDGIATICFNT